jgi:hypothetical protein
MSLTDFLTESTGLYKKYGLRGIQSASENFLRGLAVRLGSITGAFNPPAKSILETDWDLLIILDACRWDIMRDVATEYDWLDPSPNKSYASSSQDWLQKTFFLSPINKRKRLRTTFSLLRDPYQNDIIADTLELRDISDVAYITGNPQSTMVKSSQLSYLEETWRRDLDYNERTRILTDQTIQYRRREDPARTIVHYMKPHEPFVENSPDGTAWQRLQWGEYDIDDLISDYKDNLRNVLEDVELLLENTDADDVVITADHGNSYGEYGFYGHRPYLPLKGMRQVPWVETSAIDRETYEPETDSGSEAESEVTRDEMLTALGYR